MSVLDSVGKGGAQVGIENLNIMASFDRTDGLLLSNCAAESSIIRQSMPGTKRRGQTLRLQAAGRSRFGLE